MVNPPVTGISPEPIVIGTPTLHDVTFTASNGRSYIISTVGATASVTFAGSDVPLIYHHHAIFHPGEIETLNSILLTDATPGKAALNIIRATAGRGTFNIGSITGGDIGSIYAQDAVATGAITLDSVHKITLAGSAGAVMSLGTYPSTLKFSGNFTGSLTAATVSSFSASALIQSTVTTTGALFAGKNQIGSITIANQIDQSSIFSAGDVGSITAGYIQDSIITAGTSSTTIVPESPSIFYAGATIHSLRVSTGRIDGFEDGFVSDSVIAAYYLGSVQLGSLAGDGGGIAGHNIASISAISPAGGLDRIKIHLVQSQMPTAAKLQSSLTHLGIAFTAGVDGSENTVLYDYSINVLH